MKVSKKQKRLFVRTMICTVSLVTACFFAVRWKLLRLREHRRPERGLPLSSIPDTVVKMKEPWKALSRRKK